MKAGKSIKGLRLRKGLTQENIANDLHVSKQLVSHLENDRRNMTEDLMKESVTYYSDAQYGFEVARETANGYITPLATANKAIEWHRLALEEVFKREADEAIKHFNKVSLVKSPDYADEDDIGAIEDGVKELLDVQTTINSFLARLEQTYPISIKDCMRKRTPEWKAKGWIG
ncbi:helix-turn-helix transcriptional regulator [Virgibacillus sediminis]|uniref:Helix-turn-helix transcriptional regulator n=1 Tax=Virgibacillus sediminis TaxID=202260 RepID=A0ABV7A650_9BACI